MESIEVEQTGGVVRHNTAKRSATNIMQEIQNNNVVN